MERRTIHVSGKENDLTEIQATKCNEMLIDTVLEPLLDIVYQYKESQSYNYIPGTATDADGWKYYGDKFQEIYKALNKNLFLSEYEYQKIYEIVEGIHSLTRQFSMADGLPDSFFAANPHLYYYTFAFSEEGKNILKHFKNLPHKNSLPAKEYKEYIMQSERYFKRNDIKNKNLNLHFDRDDFFIKELAYTVRTMFIKVITENAKHQVYFHKRQLLPIELKQYETKFT